MMACGCHGNMINMETVTSTMAIKLYSMRYSILALCPGLPRFRSSVWVQYNIQKQKSSEKQGRPGNTYHVDARWTWGGGVPDYKYVCNKPEREVLIGQAKYMYRRSCECLGSCLAMQCLMMKSSTLFHVFEWGPLPYIHLAPT